MAKLTLMRFATKKEKSISNRELTRLANTREMEKQQVLEEINKMRKRKGLTPIFPEGMMSIIKNKKIIYPTETELKLINFLGKQKEKITRDEIMEKMKIKRTSLSTAVRELEKKGYPVKKKLIPRNKKRD